MLIAAFAHELTLTYRVILTLQEMSLEYGLLFMVYGLFRLISEIATGAEATMTLVFIAIFSFRFVSVYGELQAHYNE